MRAQYIKEDKSVFAPKGADKILEDLMNIHTAQPIIDSLNDIANSIPRKTFTYEEMRELINQLVKMAADYYNDVNLPDLMDEWGSDDAMIEKKIEEMVDGWDEWIDEFVDWDYYGFKLFPDDYKKWLKAVVDEHGPDVLDDLNPDAFIDIESKEGTLEDYIGESLKDTFKPKSNEDIIKDLREAEWDEIVLKDGKSVWLVQQDMPGMAGESMEILSVVDETGKHWPLNNETLDALPFEWGDRKELVQLMDDSYQTNYNNAIAYVK